MSIAITALIGVFVVQSTAASVDSSAVRADAVHGAPPPMCLITAGTQLEISTVDSVGSKHAKIGDHFRIKLAAPFVVDGQTMIPAGTRAAARVAADSFIPRPEGVFLPSCSR